MVTFKEHKEQREAMGPQFPAPGQAVQLALAEPSSEFCQARVYVLLQWDFCLIKFMLHFSI